MPGDPGLHSGLSENFTPDPNFPASKPARDFKLLNYCGIYFLALILRGCAKVQAARRRGKVSLCHYRGISMRLRTLFLLLTAMMLAVPTAARAITITVSIDGLFLHSLGICSNAPGGCTDLINIPPGFDPGNGFPYDQVTLIPKIDTADYALPDTVTFMQDFVFNPGDTGAGSVGFMDVFSLARNVTVTETGFLPIAQMLSQTGNVLVGMFEDDLTIDASDTLVYQLNSGELSVRLGGAFLRAGIDPPGALEVEVNFTAADIPLPTTLALFGLGLAGLAARRRQTP